jgi:hypothetical protein
MRDDMPSPPVVECCWEDGEDGAAGCICSAGERALRAWNDKRHSAPMTVEQREWCLQQIGRVEGYDRKDHETDPDPVLAGNVLSAWADFCRDKGLL